MLRWRQCYSDQTPFPRRVPQARALTRRCEPQFNTHKTLVAQSDRQWHPASCVLPLACDWLATKLQPDPYKSKNSIVLKKKIDAPRIFDTLKNEVCRPHSPLGIKSHQRAVTNLNTLLNRIFVTLWGGASCGHSSPSKLPSRE